MIWKKYFYYLVINIYSQKISGIYVNETDITFHIYDKYDTFHGNKLSRFKVNNEKTYIFPIDKYTHIKKEYSFENDSLILKLKHIQEKSKKWFCQSIELEISDFTKTISDDKYGKFNFYCTTNYFGHISIYKVYWFLDNILIAIFDSSNDFCTIDKIIENILCVNENIELKKKEELIKLKKQKEKQEKIDLLL